MTRNIRYVQYHSRYSSQNFKRTWHLKHPNWPSPRNEHL